MGSEEGETGRGMGTRWEESPNRGQGWCPRKRREKCRDR